MFDTFTYQRFRLGIHAPFAPTVCNRIHNANDLWLTMRRILYLVHVTNTLPNPRKDPEVYIPEPGFAPTSEEISLRLTILGCYYINPPPHTCEYSHPAQYRLHIPMTTELCLVII